MFNRFRFGIGRSAIAYFKACAVIVFLVDRKYSELTAAQPIDTIVSTDRKQPGSKWPRPIIAMQVLVGTQKCLLRGIFSGFGLTQHAVTQIVDVRLVFLNKPCKRFVIALLRLENPGKFIVHSRSLYFLYAEAEIKLRDNFIGEKAASINRARQHSG